MMPEVKRRTPANIVVQHDDGNIESVPLSRQNRLLFDHNLWGLLKEGDEILHLSGDPSVTISPNEDSTEFTLKVEGAQPMHLGPDLKPRMVDTLITIYEDRDEGEGADPTPLVDLRDEIMENRVRMKVVDYLAEMPPFSEYISDGKLEVTENGWLFSQELLLTWECEFRHPNTVSRRRNGSVISPDSADSAYDVSFSGLSNERHSVTIDGDDYRMTAKEMDFMARALWAAEIPTPS